MADFGLRDVPVERDDALKSACAKRIVKYRNAPQDERGNNIFWISQGPRMGVGYFYALTPVYLGNRLQALLGIEQTIRMENFFTPGSLPMGVTILDENDRPLISSRRGGPGYSPGRSALDAGTFVVWLYLTASASWC